MRLILTLITTLSIAGAATASGHELANEKDINAGLLTMSIANKIRRECPTISGRLWEARAYANQLKDMAKQRGYTNAQIDSYINDSAEKAKMRERRNAYYKSKGASNHDPASLCRLGLEEIKNGGQIGAFLKAK